MHKISTIPEYPLYRVSDNGVVFNDRPNPRNNRICTKYLDKDGYERVWINLDSQVHKFVPVHKLVALAFINKPNQLCVVNHKNGNRRDNRIFNLEWILPADNERHARKVLGKRCVGEKASRSKLKDIQIIEIRRLRKSGVKVLKLADDFGVSVSQIRRVINRINWNFFWNLVSIFF